MKPPTTERVNVNLLLFIIRYYQRHNRGPTHRTIQNAMGWSSSHTVHKALGKLRRAGFVDWDDQSHGTLRPLVKEVPIG